MKIKIGLVDDHQLFLRLLSLLFNNLNGFSVVVEAKHGRELKEKLEAGSPLPDIMLIDVNMPEMNGLQTAKWLHDTHPSVRLVALSMNDQEQTVISMVKAGCCSYILKDTHPVQLEKALTEIYVRNYYDSDINHTHLSELLIHTCSPSASRIGEKECEFLQHATSDRTYKEIAQVMDVSQRTVDGYRESLFEKFNVQSRTGMILQAIKRGLVSL